MKTIPLTQNKVALVDDEDFDRVSAFKWHAQKSRKWRNYAKRNILRADGGQTTQCLHQFLMPGVKSIDHRDGNGLNNCRDNLRPATNQQNQRGFKHKRIGASSRFRGVCWHSEHQKWGSYISVSGKRLHLGYFLDEELAAKAYDCAARRFFGEFISPNFPQKLKEKE